MKTINIILIIALLIGFIGCNSGSKQTEEITGQPDLTKVTLTRDKIIRSGILLGAIKKELLSQDVHARGKVTVAPHKQASLTALMGGVVKDIRVVKDQYVKKGEVLATYSDPGLVQAQQDYLQSQSDLEYFEKELNRQKALKKENISSDKEFQLTQSKFQESRYAFEANKAKMEMLNMNMEELNEGIISNNLPILSPFNGVVHKINVNVGKYAEEQTVLFEVIDRSEMQLEIAVFEKDIHLVKKGQRVTFAPTSQTENIYEAYVKSIGSIVEPEARVVNVLANIKGEIPNLIPGMFVSSEIHTSEQYLDALPEEAIIIENDSKKYGFYTFDDSLSTEMTFHRFNVITGYVEDGYIQVEPVEQFPENAKVVLKGVYYIKAEIMKNSE
ncbi:MAG: efflux RND transporter periplasmic adaptor subunit [Bacteroidales bacterium]|nr:efflux RND transporter periplasmic adaptor subunit [Bacteroidales bacterium]